jgi:hypothetical protein
MAQSVVSALAAALLRPPSPDYPAYHQMISQRLEADGTVVLIRVVVVRHHLLEP